MDASSSRMNAKIREAQLQKVPYMLVVGDKEVADNTVAVRTRNNEDRGAIPLDEFKQIVHGFDCLKVDGTVSGLQSSDEFHDQCRATA